MKAVTEIRGAPEPDYSDRELFPPQLHRTTSRGMGGIPGMVASAVLFTASYRLEKGHYREHQWEKADEIEMGANFEETLPHSRGVNAD